MRGPAAAAVVGLLFLLLAPTYAATGECVRSEAATVCYFRHHDRAVPHALWVGAGDGGDVDAGGPVGRAPFAAFAVAKAGFDPELGTAHAEVVVLGVAANRGALVGGAVACHSLDVEGVPTRCAASGPFTLPLP